MIDKNIREKKHRLPLERYKGQIRVTFTLCIKGRKVVFTNKQIMNEFIKILKKADEKHFCRNWAYVFMPDHLHLVAEGLSDQADAWKMINLFKQKTGFWLAKNKPDIKWQKDFFDHIHREEDDLKKHIAYILKNPLRKGLVCDWKDYPFKGSLDFSLEDIL
ncbi:MAG: transposase [Elusimicrobia bacterium]|nr:transposase [Elusimicrobiota bacterium]